MAFLISPAAIPADPFCRLLVEARGGDDSLALLNNGAATA